MRVGEGLTSSSLCFWIEVPTWRDTIRSLLRGAADLWAHCGKEVVLWSYWNSRTARSKEKAMMRPHSKPPTPVLGRTYPMLVFYGLSCYYFRRIKGRILKLWSWLILGTESPLPFSFQIRYYSIKRELSPCGLPSCNRNSLSFSQKKILVYAKFPRNWISKKKSVVVQILWRSYGEKKFQQSVWQITDFFFPLLVVFIVFLF